MVFIGIAVVLTLLQPSCQKKIILIVTKENLQKALFNDTTASVELPEVDSMVNVKINIVGDIMCHRPQMNNAKTSDSGSYNFDPSFKYISQYLKNADLTIGNLETTFAGDKYPFAGYPAFNTPDQYATALKNAGFDLLVTANNHSMDTQEAGLIRTLKILKKNNLEYTGTFNSQIDHDRIRIVSIDGLKLAILNYTYGTNGNLPTKKHSYLLNIIDSATICSQIKIAKLNGADEVLVFYHYGLENNSEPTKLQLQAVNLARNCGAKIIIGAHPHVISPLKFIKPDQNIKDSILVAYSLGNFISNQYWRYTDAGVILSLYLQKNKNTNEVLIKKVQFLPTWVYRGNSTLKQHIVFPAELHKKDSLLPKYITQELKIKMAEAYNDTKKMITKYQSFTMDTLISNIEYQK